MDPAIWSPASVAPDHYSASSRDQLVRDQEAALCVLHRTQISMEGLA